MAHETLPNKDAGAALAKYESDRRNIVGSELARSGGKTIAVGLWATAAVFAAAIPVTVLALGGVYATSAGWILTGGGLAYGVGKSVEGLGKRLRALFSKRLTGGSKGGHH